MEGPLLLFITEEVKEMGPRRSRTLKDGRPNVINGVDLSSHRSLFETALEDSYSAISSCSLSVSECSSINRVFFLKKNLTATYNKILSSSRPF